MLPSLYFVDLLYSAQPLRGSPGTGLYCTAAAKHKSNNNEKTGHQIKPKHKSPPALISEGKQYRTEAETPGKQGLVFQRLNQVPSTTPSAIHHTECTQRSYCN